MGSTWYEKAVFYHIYPLGLLGAPKQNTADTVCDGMKELLITLITLAGLFIGVYYHDSLVGGGQENQQQKTETSVSGQ